MEKITNFKENSIFFIGIGGISMSALAEICLCFGAKVAGSDTALSDQTAKLTALGAQVFHGHNAAHMTNEYNIVVYSGAIHSENVEYQKAKELGIKLIERSEFLGMICSLYEKSIVVTGTHGKTTTTALVGDVLSRSGLNPTIHLGGLTPTYGNFKLGNKAVFVSEGCEYRNSIKYLTPTIGVITNIELDHTDFYKDYSEVEAAFLHFANSATNTVIVFENPQFAAKITAKINVVQVGFGNYDIAAKNLVLNLDGTYSFDVFYGGYIGKFKTNQIGLHNAKNALCAIAVGLVVGEDVGTIYGAVRSFLGVKRRLEKVGEINGTPVICDYAHHPTEIANSLACVSTAFKRVFCVFQPHTFSRTVGLKKQFLECFNAVKKLVIFKTYPARENYIVGGSAKELFNALKFKNKTYCDNQKQLYLELIKPHDCDVVLVLGAGDIYNKVVKIVKKSEKLRGSKVNL